MKSVLHIGIILEMGNKWIKRVFDNRKYILFISIPLLLSFIPLIYEGKVSKVFTLSDFTTCKVVIIDIACVPNIIQYRI